MNPRTQRLLISLTILASVAARAQSVAVRRTNFHPPTGRTESSDPRVIATSANHAWLVAETIAGSALVVTDGTAAGTRTVGILYDAYPDVLATVSETLYFVQRRPYELWECDAIASTLGPIYRSTLQLRARPASSSYFVVEQDSTRTHHDTIWELDPATGALASRFSAPSTLDLLGVIDSSGDLVIRYDHPVFGAEPCLLDGSGVPQILADIEPGPGGSEPLEGVDLGSRVLFRYRGSQLEQFGSTDGTPAGTDSSLLPSGTITMPSGFRRATPTSTHALINTIHGLWGTDGTPPGTAFLVPSQTFGVGLQARAGALGYSYFTPSIGGGLRATDGVSVHVVAGVSGTMTPGVGCDWLWEVGTQTLHRLAGSPPAVVASQQIAGNPTIEVDPGWSPSAHRVLLRGNDPSLGSEPVLVDWHMAAATTLVDLHYGATLVDANRRVRVAAGNGLTWLVSSTAGGFYWAGSNRALMPVPSALGDAFAMAGATVVGIDADQWGTNLDVFSWAPGQAGPTLLRTLPKDFFQAAPYPLQMGEQVVVFGKGSSNDLDAYITDGTVAGTRFVDTIPIQTVTNPVDAFREVGRAFVGSVLIGRTAAETVLPPANVWGLQPFDRSALMADDQRRIWRYDIDGTFTPLGTGHLLLTARNTAMFVLNGQLQRWDRGGNPTPGIQAPSLGPNYVLSDRGTLFWFTYTALPGYSIRTTDGLTPPTSEAVPFRLVNEALAVPSHDLVIVATERTLWTSDGTTNGTTQWIDLGPGRTAVDQLRIRGTDLMFAADDGTGGREYWSASLQSAANGRGLVVQIGDGCPGATGTPFLDTNMEPRVDSPGFALNVEGCPPGAYAVLGLAVDHGYSRLGPACASFLGAPVFGAIVFADTAGNATLPLPIPASAGLRGVEVFAQGLVQDPTGLAPGGFTTTDALVVAIGR